MSKNKFHLKIKSAYSSSAVFLGFSIVLGINISCNRIEILKNKFFSKKETTSEKPSSASQESFEYFKVVRGKLDDSAEFRGQLTALETVELRADKRIRVNKSTFKLFDVVKKGTVIFIGDTKDLEQKKIENKEKLEQARIELKNSENQLAFAEKQYERKKSLDKKGIIPKKEFEESEKQYELAKNSLDLKKLDLRKVEREFEASSQNISAANFVSPIDGIISKIYEGNDEVRPGFVLAKVANPSKLMLSVEVDEVFITRFKKGMPAKVKIDAIAGKILDAKVINTDMVASKNEFLKFYRVDVEIDSELVKKNNLREGYEASLIASFESKDQVIKIPLAAVKKNGNENFVLVASSNQGSSSPRAVKLGLTTELETEVLQGVNEGEFVLVGYEKDQGDL